MNPKIRRAIAALFAVLALPVQAQARLTLQEALQLATARSQQLVAFDAAASSARETAVAAGQLPDPVLKAGIDNLPVNGPDRFSLTNDFMTMRRVGVMQELTSADKRRLRTERAERDVQRIRAERDEALANIQRETALAWIERRYTAATLELLQTQGRETRLQIEGAEA